MKNNLFKLLGLLIVAVFIAALFQYYHLGSYLSIEGFTRYHQQLLAFEEQHSFEFTLVYVCGYIVLITCCIPGTILLDLLAGFIYGPYWGTLWVILSYLIGSIVNFLLVRYFFSDLFLRRFHHLREAIPHERGFHIIALNLIGLRLIPVIPFWVLNILAAILAVPMWLFIVTTLIGATPLLVIYVLIGSNLRTQIDYSGLNSGLFLEPQLWLPLLILALLIIVPNAIKLYRSYRQKHSN